MHFSKENYKTSVTGVVSTHLKKTAIPDIYLEKENSNDTLNFKRSRTEAFQEITRIKV